MRWLRISEVARRLDYHPSTVLRMVHDGRLPSKKFGRQYRVPEYALDQPFASANQPQEARA